MSQDLICPECQQDMSKYLDNEWDGKCPICGKSIAMECYRFKVLESNEGTLISGVDKVRVDLPEESTQNLLNGKVVEVKYDQAVFYLCIKPKPLVYVMEGWRAAYRYLTLNKGFTDKRWTLEGVVQDN